MAVHLPMMGAEVGLAYLFLGAVVGFFAGLLGIGGGSIMVPVLVSLFLWQDYPEAQVIHLALGTSMAAIVPTALVSMLAHNKKGAVLWPVVWLFSPGTVIAAFATTFVVAQVSSVLLAVFFFCFMSIIAWQMWLNNLPQSNRKLPSGFALTAVGVGIGGISTVVAMGGGTLTVPFLLRYNVPIKQAIATSAATGFPLSVAATLGYAMNGGMYSHHIPYSVGYVSIPAVLVISLMSVLTVPLGVNMSHRLSVKTLKKVFSVLLMLLGLKMLLDVLWY